jgi:hypothetical protein
MCRNLDFASYDDYPSADQWARWVFLADLFRPARPGRAFWLMETSVSHNGWLGSNGEVAHPRGFLEAEAVLNYSLGAEAVCYWLWRQPRSGCELPHSAVFSAWFRPSIGHAAVQGVERARQRLQPLLGGAQAGSGGDCRDLVRSGARDAANRSPGRRPRACRRLRRDRIGLAPPAARWWLASRTPIRARLPWTASGSSSLPPCPPSPTPSCNGWKPGCARAEHGSAGP